MGRTPHSVCIRLRIIVSPMIDTRILQVEKPNSATSQGESNLPFQILIAEENADIRRLNLKSKYRKQIRQIMRFNGGVLR